MPQVLYEDKNIIVVNKPLGMLSEDGNGRESLVSVVCDYMNGEPVYILHRLDCGVGGAVAFAKNKKVAAEMSSVMANHGFYKEYLAVLPYAPSSKQGELCDMLFKDSSKNKVFVVKSMRKGAKEAKLKYETIKSSPSGHALVRVMPYTGRTHQIRVQFASRKLPILGDGKYGSRIKCGIALFCHRLKFEYPSGKVIDVSVNPPSVFPFSEFYYVDMLIN
ncbi:MAG: RNA pseudouridine synthase [Eubacteriales bacterium]|nr:RNA pseudouridine synthase [Eubacteriales bacterium]